VGPHFPHLAARSKSSVDNTLSLSCAPPFRSSPSSPTSLPLSSPLLFPSMVPLTLGSPSSLPPSPSASSSSPFTLTIPFHFLLLPFSFHPPNNLSQASEGVNSGSSAKSAETLLLSVVLAPVQAPEQSSTTLSVSRPGRDIAAVSPFFFPIFPFLLLGAQLQDNNRVLQNRVSEDPKKLPKKRKVDIEL